MSAIIQVENLAKRYLIGHRAPHEGLRHRLENALKAPFRRKRDKPSATEEFWALQDVTFEVQPGEVVGIIGRNGAGKSTLLKVLSRITEPTRGRVIINGRVASLLEVGTGFHPELTGRENIFLNGAILGMSRAEIRAKFDEIVAFAEVEKFIDTPVKRYSSGMYVRLAFAVAAHLEPEILIVDEVLAVGDYEFQAKCLDKMREVSGQHGRTVLFVSHNITAVGVLTDRCLLLEHGRVKALGVTKDVIREYLAVSGARSAVYQTAPALERPSIVRAEVITSEPNAVQHHGSRLVFEFDIHMPRKMQGRTFSFQILDGMERPVAHIWRLDHDDPVLRFSGVGTLRCEIGFCRLNVGQFSIRAFLGGGPGEAVHEVLERVCCFEVVIHDRQTLFGWRPEACAYLEDFSWSERPPESAHAVTRSGATV